MPSIDELKNFLTENLVSVTELDQPECFAIHKRWTSIYGRFNLETPCQYGSKAVAEFLSLPEREFLILFLSSRIKAFPISTNSRPCSVIRVEGLPMDISSFHELEFAITSPAFEWTLVHTHEDWSFGGPYFIRGDHLPASTINFS